MHPEETAVEPLAAIAGTAVAAIPARWASTRLPGKPLRMLAGRSLVEHVYRRARRATAVARVVVLTDDERIARAVQSFGGEVEMTPPDCASGTDRVAWAARRWDCDSIINVQGDEPLIDPAIISRIATHLAAHPEDALVTVATPAAHVDHADPDVVKVVADREGRALYFSRAPIPFLRGAGGAPVRRHVGIYGYRRETLLALAALAPSPLEVSESLEQLRALENGIPIRVIETASASPGVDTEDDLRRIEALLADGTRIDDGLDATPRGG